MIRTPPPSLLAIPVSTPLPLVCERLGKGGGTSTWFGGRVLEEETVRGGEVLAVLDVDVVVAVVVAVVAVVVVGGGGGGARREEAVDDDAGVAPVRSVAKSMYSS